MKTVLAFFTALPLMVISTVILVNSSEAELDYESYQVNPKLAEVIEVKQADNELEGTLADLSNCYSGPYLGNSFNGFKEALAFKESSGNYNSVNTLGYLGKYQFGAGTLKLVGIHNTINFLHDAELQEKAFIANTMRNKWILRRDIKRFVGKRIDGVLVTESGILAAAHLAGPGSVKKYLRSYGAIGFSDAYGTSIQNYMKRFSGYDTSSIPAQKNIKVSLL